ncbi:hypothetical protein LBX01_08455 [Altererythrobacter sp. N1]|nr:hypothetical protein LBX01_08455 [Altererythrobacter sp. N1]
MIYRNLIALLLLSIGLVLIHSGRPALANEAAGHTYSTITIPAGTATGSLNEYSRIGATVTFQKTPSIADFESCSGEITCKNLVSSTARISMSCDGDESLKGGWDSEVLTGNCWSSMDACYYAGTINEDCPPLDPDAKKAVNNDYLMSGFSNCTTGDKGMCAYENSGSAVFSTATGDDMFKIQDGASAFLDYRRLGTSTTTPYKLRWVHRHGGDANRALMIPSGPFVSTGGLTPYADYRRFMANPPSIVTTAKSCFPVEVSFCEGDFAAPAKRPQNGACGTLAGTYMGSPPANNLPETTTLKCLKGMDTPVTTNTSYEPSAPNRYEWKCNGLDGGSDASCFAYLPWNGQCGSANGSNSYTQPTSNLCYKGDVTPLSRNDATNQWTWTCKGRPGAPLSTDANCSANIIIDGSCGSAAGADFTTAPSGPNLCEYGNPTSVTQDTCSWKWTCNGIHGGTNMSCQANRVQLCSDVGVYATWRYFGSKSDSYMFPTNDRLRDNCPANYTATELRDDNDSDHSLSEDNYKGGDRAQLCIGTGNSQVSIKSEWNYGGCTAGMIHTGVFDSYETNTDPGSKHYRHKHDMNEEDNTSDNVYWCLGLDDPSNRFDLSLTQPYSRYCPTGSTLLVNANGTEWNVNNEDGSINRAVCAKITPKPGATCPVCAGGCGSANGVATSTAPSGGSLCSSGSASAVTSTSDTYLWSCTASGVTSNCSAPKVSVGICGSATEIETSIAPTDDLCALGNDSPVVDNTVEWSWSCSGLNGGAAVSCTAPKPACVVPLNGSCSSTAGACSAGSASNDNGATSCGTTRTWKCVGENGGSTANCSKANAACPTIVNGVCGSADNSWSPTEPTTNLCSSGTPSARTFNPGDSSCSSSCWDWSCAGSGGGTTDYCYGYQGTPQNGVCGSANGGTFSSTPTSNLCSQGTVSGMSGSGPWTWNCLGWYGGTNASCSASYESSTTVNGVCGPADGMNRPSAWAISSGDQCSQGTPSEITDDGNFHWTCSGTGGGTTATCGAYRD